MKTAIIGTGAIGGYYGGMLAKAGNEVHFLLRSDYLSVKEKGLEVISPDGDFHLKNVNAWNNVNQMPVCELVVLTLKATLNQLLPSLLPPVCNENTKVLVLQNGLDVDIEAAKAVPGSEVLGGLCAVACNKTGPGKIRHIAYKTIRMGHFKESGPAGITKELKEISKVFEDAGIPVMQSKNMEEARWRKLVWNMTFNGLTTILKCNTQQIINNPEYRDRARLIMMEVVETANLSGMEIEQSFVEDMMTLTDNMEPYLPSMKLDHEAGREMELDAIYKRPLIKAAANNVNVPELKKLYKELLKLES
jgi:2-dehydropantoate 2-reductase